MITNRNFQKKMASASSTAHLAVAAKLHQQTVKHNEAGNFEKAALSKAMEDVEIGLAYESQQEEVARTSYEVK